MQLGCVLLYAWCCENRPIYEHGEKWHDFDFFVFLSFGLIVAAFLTVKPNKNLSSELLNRDQTEEWKGWMQVLFLLYHYFHVSEVYNLIRVLISCYVWMTGFGNFSFFYIKSDFGFVRFYQMFWRLNFLVFFLCLTTNNFYILYYICPLHTFYFLVTFATMRVYSSINHSKHYIKFKLIVVGIIIYIVWEFDAVFNFVFGFISTTPHEGYPVGAYGVKYEWQFRSGLDHYSTYFGMIFALNFPLATLWLVQVENQSKVVSCVIKVLVGILLGMCVVWYYSNVFILPKLEFNQVHAYTFIFPLSFYIFMRNSCKFLRERRSLLLESIGKVTLETYLLQHHIWLTSNAKTLLILIPNFPKVNFLFVTLIYFVLSKRMYRLTINLRARCIPNNLQQAYLSLVVCITLFTSFYLFSFLIIGLEISWFLYSILLVVLSISAKIVITMLINHRESVNLSYMLKTLTFVAIILSLLTVPLSTFDKSISGVNFNSDQSVTQCLQDINDFEISKYDFNKILSNQILINSETLVLFNKKNRNCQTKTITADETQQLLQNKKILFVLSDYTSFMINNFETYFDLQNDDLDSTFIIQQKQNDFLIVPHKYDVVITDDVEYLRKSTDKKQSNSFIFIKKTEEDDFFDANVGIIDLHKLVVDSEIKDLSELWNVVPQMLINNIKVLFKYDKTIQKDHHKQLTTQKAKGSGGGIAQSPYYGFLMLCLSAVMLILSDNYLGFSYFAKLLFPGSGKVTWEEAVAELHKSIGISPKKSLKENDLEAKAFISQGSEVELVNK